MTTLRVTFLGTSAAQPTIRRGLSATAVNALGEHVLIDCGEGTQRQMLRYGVGLRLDAVFFTHFHADHYLGIIGLLRTLAMGGQTTPLQLYGPGPFVDQVLPGMLQVGADRLQLDMVFHALEPGERVERAGYSMRAVPADHRVRALGYVLEEHQRPGRFDVGRAGELGVPRGPLFGRLQAGQSVVLDSGRVVHPSDVLGPARRGRKLGFSGDTRPTDALVAAARGADLLVHEATFTRAEQERAEFTRHSTGFEAGEVARRAGVQRLVLTHFSSRYDMLPGRVVAEAREVYDGQVVAAEDGLSIELPLED